MRDILRGGTAALLATTLAATFAATLATGAWSQTTGGDDASATDSTAEPAATQAPASAASEAASSEAQAPEAQPSEGEASGAPESEASDAQASEPDASEAPASDVDAQQGEPAPEGAAGSATGQQAGDAAEEAGYAMGDIVLGDPDAPLTVIEYASFTCPHCGSFAAETFPEVKEQYIDTGKVKFILREVYFDQYGLWASMVARCGGEKAFYPLAEAFLTTQSTWTRAPDIGHAIQQVGRRAGLPAEQLEQCLSDRDFAKDLLAAYQENMAADEVTSTPTFIIGDESYTGAMSFEDFSGILDGAL